MNSLGSLIAQFAFVGMAGTSVFSFVTAAKDGEARRVCTPICSLAPDYAARNRTVPEFELADLNGNRVKMSDFRGKAVVLNFWTKTCKPCLAEMPSLRDLGEILQAHPGVELVTITTDESAEDALRTLGSLVGANPPFVTLVDPDGEIVQDRFGTELYPETWFIDPDGVIRARVDGSRDWRELAPLVVKFAQTLTTGASCEVSFARRDAQGPQCDGIPAAL